MPHARLKPAFWKHLKLKEKKFFFLILGVFDTAKNQQLIFFLTKKFWEE